LKETIVVIVKNLIKYIKKKNNFGYFVVPPRISLFQYMTYKFP